MVHSNQGHESQSLTWLTNHPMVASTFVYLILCVPAFLWLEGPVDGAGTIDSSVVLIGLATAAILFVPVIESMLIRRFTLSSTERFTTEEPSS